MQLKSIKTKNTEIFILFGIVFVQILWLLARSFRPNAGFYEFRQSQTLWPVKIWANEGFSPFNPKIPIKGIEQEVWILELPLFQWIVYLMHEITRVNIDYLGRLLSLLLSLGVVLIISLILARNSKKKQLWYSIFLITNPFFYYWSTTTLVDWLALFFGAWAGYLIFSKYKYKFIIKIIVIALLSVGSTVKISHVVFGFFLIYILELHRGSKVNYRDNKIYYFLTLVISIVFFLIYSSFTSNLYGPNDSRRIWSTVDDNYYWYFGTFDQYKNLFLNIGLIIDRLILLSSSLILFIFLVILIFLRKNKILYIFSLLFLSLGYLMVFINLNLNHDYYQIPVYFVLMILLILGIEELLRYSTTKLNRKFTVAVIFFISCISAFSSDLGQAYMRVVNDDFADTRACAKSFQPQEWVFTLQVENPHLFYHCNQKSFMVALGRQSDENMFNKEKYNYREVYVLDLDHLEQTNQFLNKIGGRTAGEIESNWHLLVWE